MASLQKIFEVEDLRFLNKRKKDYVKKDNPVTEKGKGHGYKFYR
jgi:hypothetical protein